jgi:hypothetical protein
VSQGAGHALESSRRALETFEACHRTIGYCLHRGGERASREHITSMLDCADACVAMVTAMARGSELSASLAALCAEACNRCADACDRFTDDEILALLAETCRRCAAECTDLAASSA